MLHKLSHFTPGSEVFGGRGLRSQSGGLNWLQLCCSCASKVVFPLAYTVDASPDRYSRARLGPISTILVTA